MTMNIYKTWNNILSFHINDFFVLFFFKEFHLSHTENRFFKANIPFFYFAFSSKQMGIRKDFYHYSSLLILKRAFESYVLPLLKKAKEVAVISKNRQRR